MQDPQTARTEQQAECKAPEATWAPTPASPRPLAEPSIHTATWAVEPQSRGSQHFMMAEPLDVLPGWMQDETQREQGDGLTLNSWGWSTAR